VSKRTNSYIQWLEQRLVELTTQNQVPEIQASLQNKEHAEEEVQLSPDTTNDPIENIEKIAGIIADLKVAEKSVREARFQMWTLVTPLVTSLLAGAVALYSLSIGQHATRLQADMTAKQKQIEIDTLKERMLHDDKSQITRLIFEHSAKFAQNTEERKRLVWALQASYSHEIVDPILLRVVSMDDKTTTVGASNAKPQIDTPPVILRRQLVSPARIKIEILYRTSDLAKIAAELKREFTLAGVGQVTLTPRLSGYFPDHSDVRAYHGNDEIAAKIISDYLSDAHALPAPYASQLDRKVDYGEGTIHIYLRR
jgi:hypothetical protein